MATDEAKVGSDTAAGPRPKQGARVALDASQTLTPEQRREVLEARARVLAASRVEERPEVITVLAFQVGGERYAVPIERVEHVLESRGLCPLPGSPRYVLGALMSRSRVVPVLDLRQLLGLEGGGMSDLAKVIVLEVGEEAFGLAAEVVDGRQELLRSGLSQPPPGPFLHLTLDRLTVLDLEQLSNPSALKRA